MLTGCHRSRSSCVKIFYYRSLDILMQDFAAAVSFPAIQLCLGPKRGEQAYNATLKCNDLENAHGEPNDTVSILPSQVSWFQKLLVVLCPASDRQPAAHDEVCQRIALQRLGFYHSTLCAWLWLFAQSRGECGPGTRMRAHCTLSVRVVALTYLVACTLLQDKRSTSFAAAT